MEPAPTVTDSALKVEDAQLYEKQAKWYMENIEPTTLQLSLSWIHEIRKFTPSRQLRVLELGSGSGKLAATLIRSGMLMEKYQLFEISQTLVDSAAELLKNLHTHVFYGLHYSSEATLKKVPSQSVDIILAHLFFDEIPNQDYYLQFIKRVIRKDGIMSIIVESENSQGSFHSALEEAAARVDPSLAKRLKHSYRLGNDAQVLKLFEQHGFKLELKKTTPVILPLTSFTVEAIRNMPETQRKMAAFAPEVAKRIFFELEQIVAESNAKLIARGFEANMYLFSVKE